MSHGIRFRQPRHREEDLGQETMWSYLGGHKEPWHVTEVRRPDVALLLPSARGGGAERSLVRLANVLREGGLAVDLVLAEATGPNLSMVNEAVRVVDLGTRRMRASVPSLTRYLSSEEPTSVLSAMHHVNIALAVAYKFSPHDCRVVLSQRNTLSEALSASSPVQRTMTRILAKWAYRQADAVVTVSQGVATDLRRTLGLPSSSIHVVYNPVISSDLFARAAEPLNDPWFAAGEPPVVLAIGRLEPAKDLVTLIEAFARLRRSSDARLLILGEGRERRRLEGLVERLGLSGNVRMPGFVNNPYPYFARANALALTSRTEGLPNVLIEALAFGLPIVSTDCPHGPREILKDGQLGHLVPVEDSEAVCEALRNALKKDRQAPPPEAIEPYTLRYSAARYRSLLDV